MRYHTHSKIIYFLAITLCIATPIWGETLFDSTSNPVFDFENVDQNVAFNASFSTSSYPMVLRDITLLWRKGRNENGLIIVNLLNDNNASPGHVMENLGEVNAGELPIGEQSITIPAKNKIPLNSKTRYWIQIRVTKESGALAYARQHEGYGVINEYYLNSFGRHRNSETGPYLFKVVGDPLKP